MATPRFDGVELFLQIVESGNLTEAAERLNLTRSAVGKGLARLEARLGTSLLQRSTRRQRLTEDGQAYYEHCLRALAELEAAESVLESGRQQPRGRLRASLPLAFGHHYAAPALWGLMDHFPQLEIEISFSDRLIDLAQEGFDLAVRIGALPDTDRLSARRLGSRRLPWRRHPPTCSAPVESNPSRTSPGIGALPTAAMPRTASGSPRR